MLSCHRSFSDRVAYVCAGIILVQLDSSICSSEASVFPSSDEDTSTTLIIHFQLSGVAPLLSSGQ